MATPHELTIDVTGMTCEHCERAVANALRAVPGVQDVLEVSHPRALARITAGPEVTSQLIEATIANAGHEARVREAPGGAGPAAIHRSAADFDLLVVGGGSAGFAAAIKGAD